MDITSTETPHNISRLQDDIHNLLASSDGPPYFGDEEEDESDEDRIMDGRRIVFCALLVACFFFSIILNSILLVVFARRRSFRREISNRFLMNLIVLNCVSALFLDPLFFIDLLYTSPSDSILCGLSSFLSVSVSAISMYSQFLIALDQYMAVVTPLKYTNRVNRIRCVILCVSVWCWGLLCGILFSLNSQVQLFQTICSPSQSSGFAVQFLHTLFNFLFPLMGLVIFYRRIFTAARDNTIRTRRNSSIDGGLSASNNNIHLLAPNSPSLIVDDSSSSNNNNNNTLKASMKNKITHASAVTLNLILHPESSLDGGRAAKVILLSLNAICLSWVPFFFVHFIIPAVGQEAANWLISFSMISVATAPVLSPILYAFRSRRIRKEIRLAFRRSGRSDSFRGFNFSTNGGIVGGGGKKMRRLRSFSCPQLLITSIEDSPVHPEVKSKSIFSYAGETEVKNIFKKAIFQQKFHGSSNNENTSSSLGDDLSKRRSTLPVPDETHGILPNVCSFPTSLEYANSLSPRLSRRRN